MIFKIYIAISIFSLIFNRLCGTYVARKFKRENAHLDIKKAKLDSFEKFMLEFRSVLVSFIPILHLITIIVWLVAWDSCVEAMEEKLWDFLEENDCI